MATKKSAELNIFKSYVTPDAEQVFNKFGSAVKEIAREVKFHTGTSLEIDDLEQEGFVAILQAIPRYNPDKCADGDIASAETYFLKTARLSMLKGISKFNGFPETEIEVPVVKKARLRGGKGYKDKIKGYKKKKVAISPSFLSLDEQVADGTAPLYDVIPDSNTDIAKTAEVNDVWRFINSTLPSRTTEVLKSRFKEGRTLQETGEMFNLTRERVRQIENSAISLLRKKLGVSAR